MLENAVGQERCMAGTLDSWKVSDLEIMELISFLSNEPFWFHFFLCYYFQRFHLTFQLSIMHLRLSFSRAET